MDIESQAYIVGWLAAMVIPAPTSIGAQPSTAIFAAVADRLAEFVAGERIPVLMHELGGEKERASIGPRELLERTRVALGKVGNLPIWGAGARVRTPEDAAQFAIAGCTWFTFDLARQLDERASSMSLDALDAEIVALEDRGVFQPNWHEAYVDREFVFNPSGPATQPNTLTVRLSDEALARAAVKFGPALALAEEMDRAIRGCWSGRAELPDIEVSLAPGSPATTREEMVFLTLECRRRLSVFTAIAPALGHALEPGSIEAEDPAELSQTVAHFAAIAAPAKVTVPSLLTSHLPPVLTIHSDNTEATRLAWLGNLARQNPAAFREWLEAARLTFPISRTGWPLSLGEEEARFLPQVEDSDLEEMFLRSIAGRQLLLATWDDVRGTTPNAVC